MLTITKKPELVTLTVLGLSPVGQRVMPLLERKQEPIRSLRTNKILGLPAVTPMERRKLKIVPWTVKLCRENGRVVCRRAGLERGR